MTTRCSALEDESFLSTLLRVKTVLETQFSRISVAKICVAASVKSLDPNMLHVRVFLACKGLNSEATMMQTIRIACVLVHFRRLYPGDSPCVLY